MVIKQQYFQAALGTNPIACAAPANNGDSYVLDMATTAVALGKVSTIDELKTSYYDDNVRKHSSRSEFFCCDYVCGRSNMSCKGIERKVLSRGHHTANVVSMCRLYI